MPQRYISGDRLTKLPGDNACFKNSQIIMLVI
jgi:hypothetical protein